MRLSTIVRRPARLLALTVPLLLTAGPGPSAAAAAAAPTRLQAEHMSLAADAGAPFTDPTASAGAALLLRTKGTASGSVTGPAGYRLVVRARGQSCAGPPQLEMSVDGQRVLRTAVTAVTWAGFAATTFWPGGTHLVQVSFIDDAGVNGCDRTLSVDVLSLRRPPAGHRFGLSSAGPEQGVAAAVTTAGTLGRHLDIVNFYQAWVWDSPLPVPVLQQIAAAGARPEITWEPWDPRLGATQPEYSLERIAGGGYDGYVAGWAAAAAAYGQPLLMRFGHEMNGGWYPWSPSVNGGSPTAYVAAYRHVHDMFVAAGATNVSWVWSPNVVQGMPTPLTGVYPGPAYVDMIGVDGYNGGTDVPDMGGWRTPEQVFAPTMQVLAQLAPTMPVIVNETGSSEHGGDKAAWITQLFQYLAGIRQVTALVWFDMDISGQADWRLASSTTSLAAARSAVRTW